MTIKIKVSFEELRRTARQALRSDSAPGFDGCSRQHMRGNLEPTLHRILRQVRLGTYEPSRLRPVRIISSSGKRRRVLIPRKQDRIVARVVLARLDAVERGLPSSCICRTGYDPRDAIAEIAAVRVSHPWALAADIEGAFDGVKVPDALQALRQRGAQEKLVQAVAAMLRPAKPQAPGLPQGHTLSQSLLDYFLADVDIAMHHAGYQSWRYVDDIVVLSDTREEVDGARQLLQNQLEAKGLRLHPRKTVMVPPKRDLCFLGWSIGSDGSYGPSPGAVERLQREMKGLPPGKREQRIRGWETHYGVPLASATTPAPTASPPAAPPATASATPRGS